MTSNTRRWASSGVSSGISTRTRSPLIRTIGASPAEMWRSDAPCSTMKRSRLEMVSWLMSGLVHAGDVRLGDSVCDACALQDEAGGGLVEKVGSARSSGHRHVAQRAFDGLAPAQADDERATL